MSDLLTDTRGHNTRLETEFSRNPTVNEQRSKLRKVDVEQAVAIASLWTALTETAETDDEAQVFLLMFGPWAGDRIRDAAQS